MRKVQYIGVPALAVGIAALTACSEWTIRGQGDPDTGLGAEPIADAGEDLRTVPLTDLRLDGTASSDPENLAITGYRWTLVSRPENSTSELSNADSARPFFFVDVSGEYAFDLTVKNSLDLWDSTPDRVTVNASPEEALYVQLTWDTEADLDLHLTRGGAGLFTIPGDVCWCNPRGDWGDPASEDDDGVMEVDTTLGYGPEVATILAPADGPYTVSVHYYGDGDGRGCGEEGCPETTATIRVFIDGVEGAPMEQTLTTAGQVWRAATATWPGGAVSAVNTVSTTTEFTCF